MKPFERWEIEEVKLTFGVKELDSLPALDEWMSAEEPINDFDRENLLRNHRCLRRKANLWSEDEVKFFSILRRCKAYIDQAVLELTV
jgi:hypothetical protein